jgi:undecaprenyl-diphosphatase
MSIFQALALGALQGATEFLPVSSSGHLALLEHIWGMPSDERMALAAALHVGTALAVVVFFRRQLWQLVAGVAARDAVRRSGSLRMAGYMVLSSLPAVIVGLVLRDVIDRAFSSPLLVGVMLFVTAGLLLATRFVPERGRTICWWVALTIGAAQAVAILPGVSRSGATIAMALFLGMKRGEAFDYSFLLSVPVVIGAAGLELVGLDYGMLGVLPVVLGVSVSFLAGLGALMLLRGVVAGRRLYWFSGYCAALGAVVVLLLR